MQKSLVGPLITEEVPVPSIWFSLEYQHIIINLGKYKVGGMVKGEVKGKKIMDLISSANKINILTTNIYR